MVAVAWRAPGWARAATQFYVFFFSLIMVKPDLVKDVKAQIVVIPSYVSSKFYYLLFMM